MFERITIFILVLFQHSFGNHDPHDLKYAHETCFLEKCLSTFHHNTPYPMCGTDGNPYPNWKSINCSDFCAQELGWKVRSQSEGLCPGLANARDYWNMIKTKHQQ
ncbi:hypothetical protein WA026_023041 [Henosepilachna vigintioctopunctata]|uniref:Kazal-like domain-containing protein n=1 Tax=Henosepilachna vigintioctopunctata TaxID=420089 RepID=A0AAW1VC65_9CUCU